MAGLDARCGPLLSAQPTEFSAADGPGLTRAMIASRCCTLTVSVELMVALAVSTSVVMSYS